ncbi:MAG: FAD-dependent oxidoreductase [Desulfovibrionaceae bacterium]|nr:FAD-dependent oxidoreductase [Desulfovibrionaceae bacterium]
MKVKYAIIGAGPTGLGAANRLRELGEESFVVLERDAWAGGLAASFSDPAGFTWDLGGHVIFSHYEYFDRLLDDLLAGQFLEHQRESWVRACGTWVPYPFQNNVRRLPPEDRWRCVKGLLPGNRPKDEPTDFHQWIERVFGRGIAEIFMWPYNFKVWATPAERMSFSWIAERVSVVDLETVIKNIVLETDDLGWGPNNTFRFPLFGGTGEIFRRLAGRLKDRVLFSEPVTRVDARSRTLGTETGLTVSYHRLLNTGPLDRLILDWLASPGPDLVQAARRLTHNSVHVSGVGVRGGARDPRCWMYFPGPETPFYRATNFHNYSPNNAAEPGRQRALMCETAFSEHKPEDLDGLSDRTVDGLAAAGLLDAARGPDIVSKWQAVLDYAYPVPCLERDQALRTIQPQLEALDIFSRGRFGGWRYEVGNMDHSLMQGVEWAERMVLGKPESTYVWRS